MYDEVCNYNIVCMLCFFVFFVAWLFVCAVVEADITKSFSVLCAL